MSIYLKMINVFHHEVVAWMILLGVTSLFMIFIYILMWISDKIFFRLEKAHVFWVVLALALLFSAAICISSMLWKMFNRLFFLLTSHRQAILRDKYRRIFRVLAIPRARKAVKKLPSAEIQIGDYGWEAEPIHNDDLIYLQGLTVGWCVVWHAGFHADEIELVGLKPNSQYDWVDVNSLDSSPCPFPIQARETVTMGPPF